MSAAISSLPTQASVKTPATRSTGACAAVRASHCVHSTTGRRVAMLSLRRHARVTCRHARVSHMTHLILSMRSIPKVVGGYDEHSLALADALYSAGFTSIHKVSSCRVAEASKIVENVRARPASHVPSPPSYRPPLLEGHRSTAA